jgi:hypothetical protein
MILGQVCSILFNSSSLSLAPLSSTRTPAIRKLSRRTILSSCSSASCFRIFSKPTSSTTLLPIWIKSCNRAGLSPALGPRFASSSSNSDAYFWRRASRKLRGGSAGLFGRTNDPAVGFLLLPERIYISIPELPVEVGLLHLKYFTPLCSPECFPRVGSSHSTPSQSPLAPSTSPMYRTVHRAPSKDNRCPT